MEINIGDYVKARTQGGVEFYGDVTCVWKDGRICIIPDGAKYSIEVDNAQVTNIERAARS